MTFKNSASENPGAKPHPEDAHLPKATDIRLVDLREATSAQLEQILGGSAADFAALALSEIRKVIAEGASPQQEQGVKNAKH